MRHANKVLVTALCFIMSPLAYGDRDKDHDEDRETSCSIPRHVVHDVQAQLAVVVQQNNGGIFNPNRMWSAVVDRQGVLCSIKK